MVIRDLRELYHALVLEGVIGDAEFWRSRGSMLAKSNSKPKFVRSKTGLSSLFTPEMTAAGDGKAQKVRIVFCEFFAGNRVKGISHRAINNSKEPHPVLRVDVIVYSTKHIKLKSDVKKVPLNLLNHVGLERTRNRKEY